MSTMHEGIQQSSMAVLIDYENLALGMPKKKWDRHDAAQNHRQNFQQKTKPNCPLPDVKLIFERLVDKGRIVVKRAYCDWQRFTSAISNLHELGIELIEIPDRAYTGKNSADIRLSVDAVEMCLTKEHIDTFVILSGDSDFSPLVAKLKEFGKTVIGVGMEESTSSLLVENCDEFIYYEEIVDSAALPDFEKKIPPEKHDCYRLLFESILALQRETDGAIFASLLKQTMRRKRPQFSESSYGYRNFTALLKDAADQDFITLHQDQRSGTIIDGFCE